jgi:hypothetical protein
MTIPWMTAKLALYYLQLNIALHELENGKITINPRVLPIAPPPLSADEESNELLREAREITVKMQVDFIASQKVR